MGALDLFERNREIAGRDVSGGINLPDFWDLHGFQMITSACSVLMFAGLFLLLFHWPAVKRLVLNIWAKWDPPK